MKRKMFELHRKNKEFISYLFFGFMTTAVNWITYSFFVQWAEFSITASNALAWIVAVIFAFVTNKLYVFGSRKKKMTAIMHEAFLFFGSRFFSGLIEVFLPGILFDIGLSRSVLGIKGFLSKVFVSIIVIILNYVFSKFFVFKSDRKDHSDE